MCRVEGDKHATRELNVSVDNYKGLKGLFVSGKLIVCDVRVKQSPDLLDSISKQRINKTILKCAMAMLSLDFVFFFFFFTITQGKPDMHKQGGNDLLHRGRSYQGKIYLKGNFFLSAQ